MAVEHDGASPFYLSYFEGWQQHFVPFGLGAMQLGREGIGHWSRCRGWQDRHLERLNWAERGDKTPEPDATMK